MQCIILSREHWSTSNGAEDQCVLLNQLFSKEVWGNESKTDSHNNQHGANPVTKPPCPVKPRAHPRDLIPHANAPPALPSHVILQQNDGSLEPDSPKRGTAVVSLESQCRTDSRKQKLWHEPCMLQISTKAAPPKPSHPHKRLQHPKGPPAVSAPSIMGFSATGPHPSTDDTSHSHPPAGLPPAKEGLTQHRDQPKYSLPSIQAFASRALAPPTGEFNFGSKPSSAVIAENVSCHHPLNHELADEGN